MKSFRVLTLLVVGLSSVGSFAQTRDSGGAGNNGVPSIQKCEVTVNIKKKNLKNSLINGYQMTSKKAPFKLVIIPGKPWDDYDYRQASRGAVGTYSSAQLEHESGLVIKSPARFSGFDIGGKITSEHNRNIQEKMKAAKNVEEYKEFESQLNPTLDIERPGSLQEAFMATFPPCEEVLKP